MSTVRNKFFAHASSDESDNEQGYDSDAAEISKSVRAGNAAERSRKRRKLSHSSLEDEDEDEEVNEKELSRNNAPLPQEEEEYNEDSQQEDQEDRQNDAEPKTATSETLPPPSVSKSKREARDKSKDSTPPGVIYLSSLPPYLKPSALRNLLTQRGFTPITRLFLAPASKAKATSKKNSRQLYTEGWIEFGSKRTARRCAQSLNATPVGGPKGGFYRDDLWNMKYLRGMGWSELMAGVREERREEEGRLDEERRTIARETKMFFEGVEEGKRVEGMKRKRLGKGKGGDAIGEVKRTWRQFEVTGKKNEAGAKGPEQARIGNDVKAVLGKIF